MTPQHACAVAVAEAIKGLAVVGTDEIIQTCPGRLLPKYEPADLDTLRVDVVPGASAALSRISRATLAESCAIVIGIQKKCDLQFNEFAYEKLLVVTRSIAAFLSTAEIEGFGLPSEDVEFRDSPESVDEEGVFRGVVTTAYQAYAK